MPIKALTLVFVCFFPVLTIAHESEQAPVSVVNKRTKAMNDHNFADFMSTYSENVAIFVYPDTPLGKGKEHVNALFAPMFKKGDVNVKVTHQLVADSYVVCESTISFSDRTETTIAIYEVRDGLIQSVRFLRDNLRATQVKKSSITDPPNMNK